MPVGQVRGHAGINFTFVIAFMRDDAIKDDVVGLGYQCDCFGLSCPVEAIPPWPKAKALAVKAVAATATVAKSVNARQFGIAAILLLVRSRKAPQKQLADLLAVSGPCD